MLSKAELKFEKIIERFAYKIENSVTPIPGFIVGLSGTDSLVAYLATMMAIEEVGRDIPLLGIHYVDPDKREGWFAREIIPLINHPTVTHGKCEAIIAVAPGGHYDQTRWADLHMRARADGPYHRDHDAQTYWVVGTINATEHKLGKYSVLANTASIQPIRTLWKSEILEICKFLTIPDVAMEYSRLPDCLCGREEFAAENIELIDAVLKSDPKLFDNWNMTQVQKAYEYIRECKCNFGWKARMPYVL